MGGRRAVSTGNFCLRRVYVFALLLTAATPLLKAQAIPPIRVNVRLVDVFVNVTDAKGAPVPGLTQQDFGLCEDGRPQKISYFERDTDMPLSIVLAIDTSGSTRKDLPIEKITARNFVHSLLRPKDRLDLMDFNSDVREVVAFTDSVRKIDAGLEDLDFGPATALYNAIYLASQSLTPKSGRKVLVLISDGGNTKGGWDYSEALEEARRGEVMVYSIIDLPIEADAGRDTDGEHAMITMSEETGGKYYYANSGDLSEAFSKVSEDLRTQYLLGYYPDAKARAAGYRKSEFRSIRVTVTHSPQAGGPFTVQNRSGYYPDTAP